MTYHILVHDSCLRIRSWRTHAAMLFFISFVAQFIIYCMIDRHLSFSDETIETYMPLAALALSTALVCGYYFIREKRFHGTMQMDVLFQEDALKLSIYGKTYVIEYDKITEVSKRMMIDRFYDQKGCYRIKLHCRGRSDLVFETIPQEYEKHLDFEQTQLFVFYEACQKAGLKCC